MPSKQMYFIGQLELQCDSEGPSTSHTHTHTHTHTEKLISFSNINKAIITFSVGL
jgi:hypothetical protein